MRALDPILRQLTIANQLSLLRLAAVPVLALTLLEGHPGWALVIYIGAAITDRLDGIAARRLGQMTALGAFLDPAADKLMMITTYVILAMPDRPRPFPDFELAYHVPAWLAFIVVARDVVMVVCSIGFVLAQHMSSFPPTRLGKWNTGVEMVSGGLFLLANVRPGVPVPLLSLAVWITTAFIVASGVHYLYRVSRHVRPEAGKENGP